jgi:hypothetical protein
VKFDGEAQARMAADRIDGLNAAFVKRATSPHYRSLKSDAWSIH